MRIFIFLTLCLSACSKEQANKGPYYDQFVGTWKSIGSSEKEEIHVKPKGEIKIIYELQRMKKVLVTQWSKQDTLTMDGNEWIGVNFRGKYKTALTIYRNLLGDTIISASSGANIYDGQLDKPQTYKRFIKIN